jgi:biopolymer transport protein ExbB/TolQ
MLQKIYVMRKAERETRKFLAAFRKANSVDEAEAIARRMPSTGIKSMFDAGLGEVRRTQDLGLYLMRDARDSALQRVVAMMTTRQNQYLEDLGSNMILLSSLAAIAPGIAGSLLTTNSVGWAAAIPAVLIYNFANGQLSKQGRKLTDFSAEFVALVSREMDRRGG